MSSDDFLQTIESPNHVKPQFSLKDFYLQIMNASALKNGNDLVSFLNSLSNDDHSYMHQDITHDMSMRMLNDELSTMVI